jgi:hypothetical protein
MADPSTTHRAYVLLHRSTGTAPYTTYATEAEIHRANHNLQRAGHPVRYVAARHLGHHLPRRPHAESRAPGASTPQASRASTPRVPLARRRRLALAKAAAVLLADPSGCS